MLQILSCLTLIYSIVSVSKSLSYIFYQNKNWSLKCDRLPHQSVYSFFFSLIYQLLNLTSKFLLVLNSNSSVFPGFKFIRSSFSSNYLIRLFKSSTSWCSMVGSLPFSQKITLSSANFTISLHLWWLDMSLTNSTNNKGPDIDDCGTPV